MKILTHLMITLSMAIYFFNHVNYQISFVLVLFISALIPNLENGIKFFKGSNQGKPRGVLHSYTFCIALSILLALFFPIVALPFFLGYSLHLFADSLTVGGIRAFWPWKHVSSGKIKNNGKIDQAIFLFFIFFDLLLLLFVVL